jgi:hypothetical protein
MISDKKEKTKAGIAAAWAAHKAPEVLPEINDGSSECLLDGMTIMEIAEALEQRIRKVREEYDTIPKAVDTVSTDNSGKESGAQ